MMNIVENTISNGNFIQKIFFVSCVLGIITHQIMKKIEKRKK